MRAWLLIWSVVLPSLAFADAIPPMPPMTCAKGSTPYQSHEGTYCAPSACDTNKDCAKGEACQLQGLCISTSIYHARPDGREVERKKAGAACSADKASEVCSGDPCEVIKRCVPKGTKATAGPETSIDTTKQPEAPETPEPPKTPDSPETPEPDPDSQPDSTSTTSTAPPTKVDKGRCSVSAAEPFEASLLGLLFVFSLVLRRRARL